MVSKWDEDLVLGKRCNELLVGTDIAEKAFKEIYIDGILKSTNKIDGKEGSYGVFIHSLSLSESYPKALSQAFDNKLELSENMLNKKNLNFNTATNLFTKSAGIDSKIIAATAPKVMDVPFGDKSTIRASAHLINDKMRVVSYGDAVEMLKKCRFVVVNSKPIRITRKIYKKIHGTLEDMLIRGLDVYALAIKDISVKQDSKGYYRYSKDYSLVAFMGI